MRYQWRKPSDLPDRIELVDTTTTQVIAVITGVGREWQWQRKTTRLLHGTPAGEGITKTLTQAKIAVLEGLAD